MTRADLEEALRQSFALVRELENRVAAQSSVIASQTALIDEQRQVIYECGQRLAVLHVSERQMLKDTFKPSRKTVLH